MFTEINQCNILFLAETSDDEESVARAESVTSQTASPSSSTSKAEQKQTQKYDF